MENGERQSAYPCRQGINPTYLRTAKITKKSVNPNYFVELSEVESESYTRAHTDFIHTLRIAFYVCSKTVRTEGQTLPTSTTRFYLNLETLDDFSSGNRHREVAHLTGSEERHDLLAQATNLVRDTANDVLAV